MELGLLVGRRPNDLADSLLPKLIKQSKDKLHLALLGRCRAGSRCLADGGGQRHTGGHAFLKLNRAGGKCNLGHERNPLGIVLCHANIAHAICRSSTSLLIETHLRVIVVFGHGTVSRERFGGICRVQNRRRRIALPLTARQFCRSRHVDLRRTTDTCSRVTRHV